MRPSIKIALLFVGIWFLGKMLFFYTQTFQEPEGVKFLVMWNILCLLMGMTVGTLIEKRAEDRTNSSTLGDIKNTMGGGMLYAVAVSGLLYLYYAKIDPSYNQRQLAIAEESVRKMLHDPKELAKVKQKNPELKSLTKEELYKKGMDNQRAMYNAGSTTTISLLGMLLLVTINAIILTVVFRRVLSRERTF